MEFTREELPALGEFNEYKSIAKTKEDSPKSPRLGDWRTFIDEGSSVEYIQNDLGLSSNGVETEDVEYNQYNELSSTSKDNQQLSNPNIPTLPLGELLPLGSMNNTNLGDLSDTSHSGNSGGISSINNNDNPSNVNAFDLNNASNSYASDLVRQNMSSSGFTMGIPPRQSQPNGGVNGLEFDTNNNDNVFDLNNSSDSGNPAFRLNQDFNSYMRGVSDNGQRNGLDSVGSSGHGPGASNSLNVNGLGSTTSAAGQNVMAEQWLPEQWPLRGHSQALNFGNGVMQGKGMVAQGQDEDAGVHKLFVGMLPRALNETDLFSMFSPLGSLQEIHLMRNTDGMSKGCAFIKYSSREGAVAAIKRYHNFLPPGSGRAMVVKYADVKPRSNGPVMIPEGHPSSYGPNNGGMGMGGLNGPGRGIPQGYGRPLNGGGGTRGMTGHLSRGMGGPDMGHPRGSPRGMIPGLSQSSSSSMYGNNGGYDDYNQGPTGRGPAPYISQGMQPGPGSMQSQQEDPYGHSQGGDYGNGMNNQGNQSMHSNGHNASDVTQDYYTGSGYDGSQDMGYIAEYGQSYMVPQRSIKPPEGPEGANLFIYHLPRHISDADLGTLFAPFGDVVSAKVFVDRKTADPKGFGFVSYRDASNAEFAIKTMNGFQIGSKRLSVQYKRRATQLSNQGYASQPKGMMDFN